MEKVQCYKCKSTPLTAPMVELCDYYFIGLAVICEHCLEKLIEQDWENQVIETK